jgi:hypothetical protein
MEQEIDKNTTIIVTGTVRSGTSVMTRMLYNAGVKVLFDNEKRPADVSNPDGYFESPKVRSLRSLRGDHYGVGNLIARNEWLDEVAGGAVKILPNNLIEGLPNDRKYAVIFMKRDFSEAAESYRLYLQNRAPELTQLNGTMREMQRMQRMQMTNRTDRRKEEFIEKWSRMFRTTSQKAHDYMKSHPDNFSIIEVELSKLNEQIGEVSEFVSGHLGREINLIVPPKNY